MTWTIPNYLQDAAASYPAVQDRFILDTLFSEGILNVAAGQGLAVQRPAGANMQVYVPPLDAIIKGDDAAGQGSYLCRMTTAEFVDITAAPTTNPRIDLIVAELIDSQYRTVSAANPLGNRLRVVKGDPAASPTAPVLPPTAIPIASVLVGVNVSSITNANLTDLRTQAGAAALKVGVQAQPLTQAQRDALTAPFDGQTVYNLSTASLEAADATSKLFGATTRPLGLMFGRGVDGDVTITGTVTLTRDMEYRSLTVAAGAVLNTAGFRVLVQGTLTNAGTIAADGSPGGDGSYVTTYTTPITPAAGGSSPGGIFGTAGGYYGRSSSSGESSGLGPVTQNAVITNALGGTGGVGGAVAGASPAGMGTITPLADITRLIHALGVFGLALTGNALAPTTAGLGGTGGAQRLDANSGSPYPTGATYVSKSGGGGGSGGRLIIVAGVLVNTGTLSARGGSGGVAGQYAAPGGGGGGGVILTFSRAFRSTGAQLVTGGAPGASSNLTPSPAATAGATGTVLNFGV